MRGRYDRRKAKAKAEVDDLMGGFKGVIWWVVGNVVDDFSWATTWLFPKAVLRQLTSVARP